MQIHIRKQVAFFPWFLNKLVFIKYISSALYSRFKSAATLGSLCLLLPGLKPPRAYSMHIDIFSHLRTGKKSGKESTTLSMTRGQMGQVLLPSSVDTCHHSANKAEVACLNPRTEKPPTEMSPDALNMKTGLTETENDVGRMRDHWRKAQKPTKP